MKKRENRSIVIALLIAAVMLCCEAGQAIAKGPQLVSDTLHNLSMNAGMGGNFYASNEAEICVFCHTPHGAAPAYPLWNHYSTTAKNFTLYNSATLSPGTFQSNLAADSASRLCLACHEGTTALNTLVKYGADGIKPEMAGPVSFDAFFGAGLAGTGVYLSNDLSKMHPIGFDYTVARAGDTAGINDISVPKAYGLRFFNDGAGNFVMLECSTCHDPHVDTDWNRIADTPGDVDQPAWADAYRPFLREPNTSSALCLACHNK